MPCTTVRDACYGGITGILTTFGRHLNNPWKASFTLLVGTLSFLDDGPVIGDAAVTGSPAIETVGLDEGTSPGSASQPVGCATAC